ncbi:thymidylate synthase [Paraflavisolibacter sp. H34]|uniref:thymidylate synthase n=1 Tax=Huijunlia imazamoxiresistens TaxID=3127457 RepID=UPI003015BBF0
MIKIKNPLARIVTLPERGWNFSLAFAESLWLAAGRNDMALPGHYLRSLYNYSDDGKFMRGGYGPRLRYFNGISDEYKVDHISKEEGFYNRKTISIDQFKFIEKCFLKDPYTRQAILTILDPAKDYFSSSQEMKETKDFPCTKSIHFLRNGSKLDVIVHMRSNDFVWGAGGVNIFNFTFMQEYFAQIIGLEVGAYYHIVDNLHYYEPMYERVKKLAGIEEVSDQGYLYNKSFNSLKEFDEKLNALQQYEEELREKRVKSLVQFDDEFFDDWAKVFFMKNVKQTSLLSFAHPALNNIAKREFEKQRGDL